MLLVNDNATVIFAGAFLCTTFSCINASLGSIFAILYQLNQIQIIEKMGIGWTYTFYAGVCSLSGATFILERQVGVNLRTDRQRDNFSA